MNNIFELTSKAICNSITIRFYFLSEKNGYLLIKEVSINMA